MKKMFALALTLVLVLGLGVTAFGVNSSSGPDTPPAGPEEIVIIVPSPSPSPVTPTTMGKGMDVYNAEGDVIYTVPEDDITQLTIGEADKLPKDQKDEFLQAYEDAKTIEDQLVKYFYWLDVPDRYKTEDAAWYKFEFKCAGEGVLVTINGIPMEVVHVDGVNYYAKLTAFGPLAILVNAAKDNDSDRVLELYDADDVKYNAVPWGQVIEVSADNAAALDSAAQEALAAAVEAAAAVEGKTAEVKWVDIPESFKTDEFVWAKYELEDANANTEVTLNGEPVEVFSVGGVSYAKLPGFGAVTVFGD